MTVAINPQFAVYPFTYVVGSTTVTGYLVMMLYAGAPTPIPIDPTIPYLGYASYAAMITALGLAAVKNPTAYAYCYMVGAGPTAYTTDALALAAAQADCNLIVAKRNAAVAASGISASNPFVTLGAPVLGPL
jgi:hypothetical protein